MKRYSPEHAQAMVRSTRAGGKLARLGLPRGLIRLIRERRLMKAIEDAYRQLDETNALLDAWEAQNPELAKRVLWAEAREAWKRAGRPRPPWYEVLHVVSVAPIGSPVRGRLYPYTGAEYKRKKREALKAAAAVAAKAQAKP